MELLSQQQPVREQTGAAGQGAQCGDPGKLRKVIIFRQMAKDDVGGATIVVLLKELRGRVV